MTANKKIGIFIATLCITFLVAIVAIVLVLTSAETATSAVSIKYRAENVDVKVEANAYYSGTSCAFTKNGANNGDTYITLGKETPEGMLSQPSNVSNIVLNDQHDCVIFEYKFTNMSDTVDAKIALSGIPGDATGEEKTNVDIYYAYSNVAETDVYSLSEVDYYSNQLLPAYTNERPTTYIYIIARVSDLVLNAKLNGNFVWDITKASAGEINTVTLNVGDIDYVERDGSDLASTTTATAYTHKTLASSVSADDLTLYPAIANKAFIGWTETQGSTNVISSIQLSNTDSTHNIIGATTAKTLYPVYKNGTVPASNLTYSSGSYRVTGDIDTTVTEFVYPDVYNNGTNGIAKVTYIEWYDLGDGVLDGNTTIESVYHGKYITYIGDYTYFQCSNLMNVYLNDNCIDIGGSAFQLCTSLSNITIPNSVRSLGYYTFWDCKSLTSIIIPNNLTSIEIYAFGGCDNLTSIVVSEGNTVYDSRNNCNAIIETATNTLHIGCKNTLIPNSVISIGHGAFYDLESLTNITIPSSVTSIGDYAFRDCTSLTSITIPNSVTSIGSYAFLGCTNLTSVTFNDTTTWQKANYSSFTMNVSTVDVSNPTQNATWLKSTSEYYNYYWRKI